MGDMRPIFCGFSTCRVITILFWSSIVLAISVFTDAMAMETPVSEDIRTVSGTVQYPDLVPADRARVVIKNRAGKVVAEAVTNEAGEFSVVVPETGTYSIHAVLSTFRSEYLVRNVGPEKVRPVQLTLDSPHEITFEVVTPRPLVPSKASSETYALSRRDIEELPRGNNIQLDQLLATVPSATLGGLKQVHIRQRHAGLQFRLDGVPLPNTVTSVFTDVLTPRMMQRADIILGGLEAQYGNNDAGVVDVTSKFGTDPGFGSAQMFGGSNETVTPSFEYGGTIGETFRYYVLNSFTTTNRGIEPPTLGHSVFHDQSNRNQTFLRGDYQLNNRNTVTWEILGSVAKFQIPTSPWLDPNSTVVGLIQSTDPGFTPVASQAVDESQEENNQYGQVVWKHDINAGNFFRLAGYFQHTRATFETDPLNRLAYAEDIDEPFSASNQDRFGYSGGIRMDYTFASWADHLIKTGFQIDRTQTINKTQVFAFERDPVTGDPTGPVLSLQADNRIIGWRESFWIQDQWTPTERLTFNLGVRGDAVQYPISEGQVSPRIGVAYKANESNVVHAYYGRLFTPPSLEAVPFAQLNTIGTTAQPENLTNNKVPAERSHYFQIGSTHALFGMVTLELTGYYTIDRFLSDAGQFGTTPLLNYFAFERGWTRGIDGALRIQLTDTLVGRGNVAWGQCKGYGLQSGQFLLEQQEIDDINSKGGVFCDHSQLMTSSAVLSYQPLEGTTITGQMLYGSGLRTADPGAKTNSTHMPSHTTYNLSLTHLFEVWDRQKVLAGFDVINILNEAFLFNSGEGSIGLGVAHAGMPRSFFFRAQLFF